MPQETLERAVLDAVATALDPAVLEAAVDRAMELVEERREATRQRRTALEDALRTVRTEEGRLIEAIKQGQGLDILVSALPGLREAPGLSYGGTPWGKTGSKGLGASRGGAGIGEPPHRRGGGGRKEGTPRDRG